MAEEEQVKTEPATPFKLREAKRKGNVAKSLEVNSFFAISGFLLVLYVWGDQLISKQLGIDRFIFSNAHVFNFEPQQMVSWFKVVFSEVAFALSPLLAVLLLLAIAANMVQTGPVFTVFPLKPDPKRLNPVQGFKRIFSTKLLFEAFKNIIKLIVIGVILYTVLLGLMPKMFGLMQSDPDVYPVVLLKYLGGLVFKLALAILVIALLDLLYTRWHFAQKMRMSRRELKEEIKRREGDPHIRARQKELQKENLKRSESVRKVPEADVLITNPTRLAIAVQYKRGEMMAPVVLAKGAGELAEKMKIMARRHRIPVIENKPLAQQLFKKVALDHAVPENLYAMVATVLLKAYAMQGKPLIQEALA